MNSVSVAVSWTKSCKPIIINIVLLTFFRNFYPSFNNNGLIKCIILNDGVFFQQKEK